MKFYLYARKSSDDSDRQILSIEAQITELQQFAISQGLQIAQVFTESKTARMPGRAVFETMMKQIENEQDVGIIAWHPDRLARNSVDGGRIIYALDSGHLSALKFPTFWFEPTPQGKFMLNIAFGQSKYYVDNLSENIHRGLRQKLRRGEFPGKPPIGYMNEPRKRTIVIDAERAPLVKKMFEVYATGDYTFRKLKDLINDMGLKTRSGNLLSYSKIKSTLSNPFYKGIFKWSGEYHEGSHELFIPTETFDEVQKILKRRDSSKIKHVEKLPFKNLMTCSVCGCSITGEVQKSISYYRCTKKRGSCNQKYIREELVEAQLRESIARVCLPQQWHQLMLKQIEQWKQEELAAATHTSYRLKEKYEKIEDKLNKLLDLFLDGRIEKEEMANKKEKLLHQRNTLKEKLTNLENGTSSTYGRLERFIKELKSLNTLQNTQDLSELRKFHKKHGSNLLLFPEIGSVVHGGGSSESCAAGASGFQFLSDLCNDSSVGTFPPTGKGLCAEYGSSKEQMHFFTGEKWLNEQERDGAARKTAAGRKILQKSHPILATTYEKPLSIVAGIDVSVGWWS